MVEPAKVERASTWSDVVEEGKKVHLVVQVLARPQTIFLHARREKLGTRLSSSYINNLLSLAYRFQLAGYKNEREYLAVTKLDTVSSNHCLDLDFTTLS